MILNGDFSNKCFRFSSVTDGNVDFTFRLHQVAVDSTSVTEIAQADFTSPIVANRYYEVVRSDFTVYDPDEETPPDIVQNSLCALSIDPSGTVHSSTQNVYITSVWKVDYRGNIRGEGN